MEGQHTKLAMKQYKSYFGNAGRLGKLGGLGEVQALCTTTPTPLTRSLHLEGEAKWYLCSVKMFGREGAKQRPNKLWVEKSQ